MKMYELKGCTIVGGASQLATGATTNAIANGWNRGEIKL